MKFIVSLFMMYAISISFANAAISKKEAIVITNMVKSAMAPVALRQTSRIRFRWGGGHIFWLGTSADHKPNKYVIGIMRGVYEHPKMTRKIFLLSICHEISHVYGGAPRFDHFAVGPQVRSKEVLAMKKLSVEGQADFFATKVCLKEVYSKFKNQWPVDSLVDFSLMGSCSSVFETADDRNACYFSATASIDLVDFLARGRTENAPSFEDRSNVVVPATDQTFGTYPALQCRLDTMIEGSLCRDEGGGECLDDDEPVELRPACWFVN